MAPLPLSMPTLLASVPAGLGAVTSAVDTRQEQGPTDLAADNTATSPAVLFNHHRERGKQRRRGPAETAFFVDGFYSDGGEQPPELQARVPPFIFVVFLEPAYDVLQRQGSFKERMKRLCILFPEGL